MVIENRQRVDASDLHCPMPHEVHLPQIVGGGVFEAARRRRRALLPGWDQAVALEDGGDRARAGHVGQPALPEFDLQFAAAPARVAGAHRDNGSFHLRGRPARLVVGRPGPINDLIGRPSQPLVAGLAADPVLAAERGHVHPVLAGARHELLANGHEGLVLPGHLLPPFRDQDAP